MGTAEKLLGKSRYSEYKKIIYYEMDIILQNKKNFIQSESVTNLEKKKRISEICDFLYMEKDMENFRNLNNILNVLQIKEKIPFN